MTQLLDPKNDVVFKMIFATPRGHRPLVALLNAILRPSPRITEVKVLNPEIPIDTIGDKGTILDIYAELQDGSKVDIEMQMAPVGALLKRALYYASRMYVETIKSGHNYKALKPVIVLFLLDYKQSTTLPGDYHICYQLEDRDRRVPSARDIQIHFLEIPTAMARLRQGLLPNDELEAGRWLGFMASPQDKIIEEAFMANAELKEAREILNEVSADDQAREIARLRNKARLDLSSTIEEARDEGRAEGRDEGRQEEKVHILSLLLTNPVTKNFSSETLAQITGLSVDEVNHTRNTVT